MNTYLIIILSIIIVDYILDIVVDTLNVKQTKTDLPEEFEGYYDAEKYKKAQNYLKENTRFGIIVDSITTPITVAFILIGGFNYVDQIARGFQISSIPTGLIFAGILMLASQILSIPFSIYSTFVIEEKYGFNLTTAKTFILDIIKSWFLTAIIGGIIFAVILWFFDRTGNMAWVYCWIVVVIFQIVLTFIAPVVILPLFNKFFPLEDGELKTSIESYAKSQDFKLKGVFKMDASKRSTKSNAFFTGFGKYRRIVLFDTLIKKHTVDELVSILAHEMGHYKKKHILKSIIISIMTTGLMFFILSLFINNEGLFQAFKMENTSIYASLFFFAFLYSPINMFISILSNILSRKHEYEADTYASETYGKFESMISALKKLTVDNLSNLTPHPLKVFLSYSHPPVLERIQSLRKMNCRE
ncbi:MAG: M48 family metalloprotease [Deltaproteobacteria bacterium]|jgi:STE24 endopeptidase|nr:M48 family metallopeptidase [Deltaproteobacteria bacterium]MCK5421522.1 M48 family metallopeptidase [Deltaproteobacteria bacterium]NOQ86628.1 M48 family metalloprotease [Deltaproteobacteria bacterium]